MTSHSFSCIGIGAPIVDAIAQVPESFLSQVGGAKGGMELIDADRMEALISTMEAVVQTPGGSAANTILGLANLGLPVTFLGKVGDDRTADLYVEHFEKNGGNISRFKKAPLPNGRCLSLVTPDSQRTMRTSLGAAVALGPDDVQVEDFHGCRHAHLEGYLLFNRELTLKALSSAREAGCTISLDLASFEVVQATKDYLPDLLRNFVDVVFANEDEATAFTGNQAKDTQAYKAMAEELTGYCDIAAVKMGKAGAWVASSNETTFIEANTVNDAIDTTGAGDAWAAGFLFGWLGGQPLDVCGSYGSLLGAEVVRNLGPNIPADSWANIHKQLGTNRS